MIEPWPSSTPTTPKAASPEHTSWGKQGALSFSPLAPTWEADNNHLFDFPPVSSPPSDNPFTLPPIHSPQSALTITLSQIAADAAEVEKEAELRSAERLSVVATKKEQRRVEEIKRREATTSMTGYQFTPEEVDEMGGDLMVNDAEPTDAEHLAEQQADGEEEQLQLQDELKRAEKDIVKLRAAVPPSSLNRPIQPSPKLPPPNSLPAFDSPPSASTAIIPKRPQPRRIPLLKLSPARAMSPSPMASTRAWSTTTAPSIALIAPTVPPTAPPSLSPSLNTFSPVRQRPSAPVWVHAAATYLNEPALGTTWAECINGWLILGQLTQYNDKASILFIYLLITNV